MTRILAGLACTLACADLRDVVAQRATHTKYRFTPDEIEEVVQYLNRSYYRMPLGR